MRVFWRGEGYKNWRNGRQQFSLHCLHETFWHTHLLLFLDCNYLAKPQLGPKISPCLRSKWMPHHFFHAKLELLCNFPSIFTFSDKNLFHFSNQKDLAYVSDITSKQKTRFGKKAKDSAF